MHRSSCSSCLCKLDLKVNGLQLAYPTLLLFTEVNLPEKVLQVVMVASNENGLTNQILLEPLQCMHNAQPSISLSWTLKLYSSLDNFQLSKAIGCPFCIKTAPTQILEASHSIVKGAKKSGIAKQVQVHITLLSPSNAS